MITAQKDLSLRVTGTGRALLKKIKETCPVSHTNIVLAALDAFGDLPGEQQIDRVRKVLAKGRRRSVSV